MTQRILIVDDDENIVKLLQLYLADAGYDHDTATDGSAAITRFREFKPDLVLLDVMLPVINGWEVLRLIKSETRVPVIMLTSRDMVDDKVRGFDLGADDYVVKPFEPREVLVRIKARLKDDFELNEASHDKGYQEKEMTAGSEYAEPKSDSEAEKSLKSSGTADDKAINEKSSPATERVRGVSEAGNLRVDLTRYEVVKDGRLLSLKPREIQLLYFLMQNRNIVFTREQLLEKVWEYDFLIDTRTVDAHVKRLRQVLEPSGSSWAIRTVWGVGYKLEVRQGKL